MNDTVQSRIDAYFSIMDEVVRQVKKRNPLGADSNEAWGGFSPSDIKEITTGISMSFKGQYGVYASPVFGAAGDIQEADADQDVAQSTDPDHEALILAAIAKFKATIIEHPGFRSGAFDLNAVAAYIRHRSGCSIKELNLMEVKATMQPEQLQAMFDKLGGKDAAPAGVAPAKEKVPTWQDALHPKTGKRLGDAPDDSQLKLARWSLTADQPENKEERLFKAQVDLMRASKGWDAEKVLLTSIADCDEYDDEGVRSGSFNDADWKAFVKHEDEDGIIAGIADLPAAIAALVAIGDERRDDLPKPSKKKKGDVAE